MLLERLIIKRLFNHYETDISFTKGINVIIGENGSGKTSIVECIMLALYSSSFKQRKTSDLLYNFEPKNNHVKLTTSLFSIHRSILDTKHDVLVIDGKRITGRENITRYIETNFVSKHFFAHIVYASQENFLALVEFTPKEREIFVNKALSLDYIDAFLKEITSNINVFKNKRTEIQFLIKKIEASKENRKFELLNEIKALSEKLQEVETILKELESQKTSIEAKHLLIEKEKWLREYVRLKREITAYMKVKQEFEKNQTILLEIKEKKSILAGEARAIQERIDRFKKIIQEGKCFYCERELEKLDYEKYEQMIAKLQMEQVEYLTLIKELENKQRNIERTLKQLQSTLEKINLYRIKGEVIKLRQKCLSTPPRKILLEVANKHFVENEVQVIKKLEEVKKLYDELKVKLEKANWELELITKSGLRKEYNLLKSDLQKIEDVIERLSYFKKVVEDYNLAGELRWTALTQTNIEKVYDIFDLGKLSFNKDFEFFVNDIPLHLCSGSQKVAVALAIRLAFLNLNKVKFIILDEPTIYMDRKRREDLKRLIQVIIEKRLVEQVILITHDDMFKEIADTLIKVEKTPDGAVVKTIF